MRKSTKGETTRYESHDREMVRAAYDLMTDIQRHGLVRTCVRFRTSEQRGVLSVEAIAYRVENDTAPKAVARYEVTFPNVSALTMSAAVFQAVIKLDHLVAAYLRAETTRTDAGT